MQFLSYYFLEARLRLLYIGFAFVFSLVLSYTYKLELVYIISQPFLDFHTKFIFLDLPEALYTIIRISGVISCLTIIPLIVYHIWSFFIPSCYYSERKKINKVVCNILLFLILELLGIYFLIFPKVCEFLMSFEIKSLENESFGETLRILSIELTPRIQSYFKLIYRFFFFILLIFQLPFVFMIFYSKKWINFFHLCEKRKYFFFLCILISAFFSPPDFVSQLVISFMAYSIYEIIVFIGLFYEPYWQS